VQPCRLCVCERERERERVCVCLFYGTNYPKSSSPSSTTPGSMNDNHTEPHGTTRNHTTHTHTCAYTHTHTHAETHAHTFLSFSLSSLCCRAQWRRKSRAIITREEITDEHKRREHVVVWCPFACFGFFKGGSCRTCW